MTDSFDSYRKSLIGRRLELLEDVDEYSVQKKGSMGIIRDVIQVGTTENGFIQIVLDWDDGHKLPYVIPDTDKYKVI